MPVQASRQEFAQFVIEYAKAVDVPLAAAGTAVMAVFQKLVEMPLTGRPDSYAPARFAEKALPVHPDTDQAARD